MRNIKKLTVILMFTCTVPASALTAADSGTEPNATELVRAAVDEWLDENNISFPVGIFEDNQEEIRQIWDVRSMPWLILTDGRHIVRAEGFASADLDEKLRNIRGN